MIDFAQAIEQHLRRVQRIVQAGVVDANVTPNYAGHEATLRNRLDQEARQSQQDQEQAQRLVRSQWTRQAGQGRLELLIDGLNWELMAAFAGVGVEERGRLIDVGLSFAFDLEVDESIGVLRRERLAEIVRLVQTSFGEGTAPWPWENVARYCERLRLVSEGAQPLRIRFSGDTWLQLRGPDRLRWLLALEAAVAVSDQDPWCMSTGQLGVVRRLEGRTLHEDEVEEHEGLVWSTVARWSALGVLKQWEESQHGVFGYRFTDFGRRLLAAEGADTLRLFHNLAEAQAEDDRAEALRLGPEPSAQAAATTMRHARLVAHEVRNALLPVNYALGKIWKALDRDDVAAALGERKRVDDGINRLYRFVEDSARMSAPAEDLPSDFLLLEAIAEARQRASEFEGSLHLETTPGTANPRCHGHWGRFVLALVNIMRNAVQVAGPQVEIWITVDAGDPAWTRLAIRDNGPGVPDPLVERIFENGVSTRPDGSGHGLALVRQVIELEMRGTIRYAAGDPGGGARFEIALPSVEASAR